MRPSRLKHGVAILRTTIGLTQRELAELAGCSVPTVQSVELGRLKLSEGLATRLAESTGVDIGWLLRNDPGQPIVDRRGRPFTRAIWEEYQAEKEYREARPRGLADDLVDYLFLWATFKRHLGLLATMMAHSYRKNRSRLCAHKCDVALLELAREFVRDLDDDEAERLEAYEKQQEEIRATGGLFFLNGLPECLLHFEAEIDREFKRRIKGVEPTADWVGKLGGAEACLVEFKATHDRLRQAGSAPAEPGRPEAGKTTQKSEAAKPGQEKRPNPAKRRRHGR